MTFNTSSEWVKIPNVIQLTFYNNLLFDKGAGS